MALTVTKINPSLLPKKKSLMLSLKEINLLHVHSTEFCFYPSGKENVLFSLIIVADDQTDRKTAEVSEVLLQGVPNI